jgi:hypothetical protein
MSKFIKELTQFFSFNSSVTAGLDSYISSKNPTNIADVERLTRQYIDRGGFCGGSL